MRFTVYILQCKDGAFYTGITNDLDRRLFEHHSGFNPGCFTYSRRPLILVYKASFQNVMDAIAFEKQLKGWSRSKKRALIKGETDLLPFLSECKNETHHRNARPHSLDSVGPDESDRMQ